MTNRETWALRAAACELLAFSFRYPTLELAQAVVSGEWAEAAEEVAAALGLDLPGSFAADARANAVEAPDVLLRALRAEATRLFVGSPDPTVSPYEGVWRAADDGVQALLFVNPHSMAVERFCKSCGLGRPEGTNEPLDHAATELELLQYLAMLEARIAQPAEGGPAPEDLPGGSAAAAYERFMAEHVLTWMPRFADSVVERSRIPFYLAATALLKAYLA
ncbi:MAG: molecular chaperone TorD family protein [Eggerthellaceae bacterium]|nr:molecular chaperone TorD family protein [Eggerthellaceae bacterium]